MASQFTPPREIDDQQEIDRLRAERRSASQFRDDGGTPEWRERQRIGRLAFMWFGIRVVFWLPDIVTLMAAYWLPLRCFAATTLGMPWASANWWAPGVVAWYLTARTLRPLGNIWAGPLVLEIRSAPRNLADATAGGLRNGLMSIHAAYVPFFYFAAICGIFALLSPPQPPLVG